MNPARAVTSATCTAVSKPTTPLGLTVKEARDDSGDTSGIRGVATRLPLGLPLTGYI